MGIVKGHVSISLDGYAAGPNQSRENPLGVGGEGLHEWAFELDAWLREHGRGGGVTNASSAVVEETTANVGAGVMGRNMFGGGPGPWPADPPWRGWWGENPPFHAPVFVLTHHARGPLEMEGGTTFHFVTDGLASAVARAREAAEDRDVAVHGGADTIRQTLRAELLDELWVHVTPRILGGGARLLDDVGDATFELVRAVDAPGVTHMKYRVVRSAR
jgi:dihydrofolate reductase